jgi:hypothetical protein
MAQGRFTAHVSAQVARAKGLMLAVRNESVQRLIAIAQTPVAKGGNLPVDTGFLRASGVATSDGSLPPLKGAPPAGDHKYSYDVGAVTLVIAQANIEATIIFAYTAKYARAQEYGSRGRAGRRFVALAAQQWPQVVAEVVAEARGRAGL